MMMATMVAALVLVAAAAVVAVRAVDESNVVVLTSDNFDDFVADDVSLVEFYAPWCGHCKRLVEPYAAAATRLAADDPPVRLAKVDATEQAELASRFDVSGYPTLKVFRNGEASDYNGPRDEAGIVKYMRAQAGPAARTLSDADAVAKFVAFDEDVSFVAYVDDASAFTKVANALREQYRFGVAPASAAADAAHAGAVVCHRPAAWKGEERAVAFDGDAADVDALRAWVPKAATPLAGVLDADTAARYAASGLARITLWTSVDAKRDPSGLRYYLNRLRKVAKEFVGKLHFVLADKASASGGADYRELNFDTAAKFALGAVSADGYRYKSDVSAFSVDALRAFATAYLDGTVERYVKSEESPADNSAPVTVLTGKTFDELVTDSGKDVFVEFYAPWCGHCKSLAPVWDELGEAFATNDAVRIAKIDATANDYPKHFDVRGFPTIYYVSASKPTEPEAYNGGRDLKDLKAYVKKQLKSGGKTEL